MDGILFAGEILVDFVSKDYVKDIKDARSFTPYLGGSPFNIAVMLGDFGISTRILGKVGDDPFGHALIDELKERGVDVSYIQLDPYHHTSMVLITKSKDYHDFLPLRGADYRLKDPQDEILDGIEILHISSWPFTAEPARGVIFTLIEKAKKRGIKLSLEPNYRERLLLGKFDVVSDIKALFPDLFLIKPSLDDSMSIFGNLPGEEYVERFHELGVKNVVLTMGKDGAIVSDGKKALHIPPLSVNPLDTTGGGDGFWTGIYYGIMSGMDIFEAVNIGNLIAAYRIESESASSRLPSLERLKEKYTRKEVRL